MDDKLTVVNRQSWLTAYSTRWLEPLFAGNKQVDNETEAFFTSESLLSNFHEAPMAIDL